VQETYVKVLYREIECVAAMFHFSESSLRSLRENVAREENSEIVRQCWGFRSKGGDSRCRFVMVSSTCNIPLLAGSSGEIVHKNGVRTDSGKTEMEGLSSEEFTIHS
jgi:hypothetical protein